MSRTRSAADDIDDKGMVLIGKCGCLHKSSVKGMTSIVDIKKMTYWA